MKTTAIIAAATLAALGAAAHAQTTDEPADEAAETAEDGTPLLPGAEGEEPIETDAEITEDGMEVDGTAPVDASPGAEDQAGVEATDATEGGSPAGEALGEASAEVATDVEVEGEAMIMDGTVPVDASPTPEEDASD